METDDPADNILPLVNFNLGIKGPITVDLPHSINGTQCPQSLDPGIYTKLASEYTGFYPACNGSEYFLAPGLSGQNYNWLSPCVMAPLRTVFGTLLAYLSNNPSLILDPQPFINLGLLSVNMTQDSCEMQQDWKHTGRITAFWNVSSWPIFELTAGLCLVLWGVLLGFASLPFRGLVFRGSLEHFMAVGSDVGAEMARIEEKGIDWDGRPWLWRLKTWVNEKGFADFAMERVSDGLEVDGDLIRSWNPRPAGFRKG